MKKIRNQAFWGIISVIVVTQMMVSWYAWNNAHNFLLKEAEEDLSARMKLVRTNEIFQQFQNVLPLRLKEAADEVFRLTGLRITIIARDGKVLADSNVPLDSLSRVENHLYRQEVQAAAMQGRGTYSRVSATVKKRLLYYCETLKQDGKIAGFIRLAMFSPAFESKMAFVQKLIFKINAAVFLMAFFGLWAFSRWNEAKWESARESIHLYYYQQTPGEWPATKFEEIHNIFMAVEHLLQTARNKERSLTRQNRDLQEIFQTLNDGIAAFGDDGRIILSNRAFSSILELEEREIAQNPYWDFLHFPPLLQAIDTFLKKREAVTETLKYYKGKWIEFHLLPLSGSGNHQFVLVCRDVTRLKELERIRSDFVTNVTHEFKTPLTSIRGFAETLYSGNATAEELRQRFLKKILNQTDRLENLVMDLIQLSKLEKKVIENLHPINPVPVILEAVEDVSKAADTEKVELITENAIAGNAPKVLGSTDLLQTIILNLLINAIRYNKADGKVWVRLEHDQNNFILSVKDTGIGIPRSEQKRIFERFYRTPEAREKYQQGTGLGLSIVRHSVELIRGRIELESEPGKGSTFRVVLPVV
ncbi:MAG: ATP-binding protein [Calditrichia bacterium]